MASSQGPLCHCVPLGSLGAAQRESNLMMLGAEHNDGKIQKNGFAGCFASESELEIPCRNPYNVYIINTC